MVYIVGAGPGDPELITVKGMNKIKSADIIIYAGSLINPQILEYAEKDCKIYNSAEMTLEEVMEVIKAGFKENKNIVRLHTGDPSIYGAIKEQMDLMEKEGIQYENIPGVSSFCGAASSLKIEYTLPSVSQTVILTRIQGRTAVPEKENIKSLSVHRATLIIFLSVSMIESIVSEIIENYGKDTPAAIVYKATWKDEKIIRGTLYNIAEKTKNSGIKKTALIIIGDCLGNDYELSKLYDKSFSHEFRKSLF